MPILPQLAEDRLATPDVCRYDSSSDPTEKPQTTDAAVGKNVEPDMRNVAKTGKFASKNVF